MIGYIILAVLVVICTIVFFLGISEEEEKKALKFLGRFMMVVGTIGLCFLWACTKNDLPDTKTYSIILTILFLLFEIKFVIAIHGAFDIFFICVTAMVVLISSSEFPSYRLRPINENCAEIYSPMSTWITGISHGKGTVIIDTTIISQRGSTYNTPSEYHLVGIRDNEGHIIIPKVCKSEDGYKDFEIVEYAQEESSKYINAIRLIKPDGTTVKLDSYGGDVTDKDYIIPWFDDEPDVTSNT